jgi:hypothetical protein
LQAAAERQLREKGELPATAAADAAAAPTANGNAAADGAATDGAAAASGGGAEDQVAKKIKNTTKEILERVAGPGGFCVQHVATAALGWLLLLHVAVSVARMMALYTWHPATPCAVAAAAVCAMGLPAWPILVIMLVSSVLVLLLMLQASLV